MTFPAQLKYTKDHEWIRLEDGICTIGITHFAQSELGDIVFVEVPTVNKLLQKGEVFGTIEAVKAVSDLFLPVSGTVIAVNPALAAEPELVNRDPYSEGWIIRLRPGYPADIDALMTADQYAALVG